MRNIKIDELGNFLSAIKKFPYFKRKNSKGNFFFPLEKEEEASDGQFILTKKASNSFSQITPGILLKYDAEKDITKGILAYANLAYASEIDLYFFLSIYKKEKFENKISYDCYLVSDENILGEFDLKKD